MEKLLVKGEKVVISRVKDPSQQMVFDLLYPRESSGLYDIDMFVFLMDERGRVLKDNIVFYNNPNLDSEGIYYDEAYEPTVIKKTLSITLSKLHDSIDKVCIACPIFYKNNSKLEESRDINIKMSANNKTLRSHMFSSTDKVDMIKDKVYILGEIYKYRDTWKYNAVKQNLEDEIMVALKKLYRIEIY